MKISSISNWKKPQWNLLSFQVPPTGFWECWGQKCFGSLGEWHKSEFSGKHPWRSAISEKVRGIAPWPPFVLSPGFIFRIIVDASKIVCRIVFKLLAKLWKHLVFTKHTFAWPVKSRCDIQRRIQNPVNHLRWSILWQWLTHFAKRSILNIWEACKCAYEKSEKRTHTN